MKAKVCIIAAALAVGGIGFSGSVYAADTSANQNSAQEDQNTQTPPSADNQMSSAEGQGVKDTHSINAVREQVKEITEAALTKNDLGSIEDRLSEEDQQRLGSAANQNSDQIDQLVKDINKKWNDKYHKGLKSFDAKVALAEPFLTINSINRAQTASEQTGASYGTEEARTASGTNANETAENGKETAHVTLNAPSGMTANEMGNNNNENKNNMAENMGPLNLTFVREHMSWKLDIPNSVDAATLRTNLQNCLQKIDDNSANWPSDEKEAYQSVTYHVMAALTGNTGNSAEPAAAHKGF